MTAGNISYSVRSPKNHGEVCTVTLTLVEPLVDDAVLSVHGVPGLRKHRLVRLAREAESQGVLLGYDDLCSLLLTSVATVKRDISELEAEGVELSLRGRRKAGDLEKRARREVAGAADNGWPHGVDGES